eukprot:TRINITY_DN88911_c0_g1_i1.p1 TRINITY_DN88911_c0_g1~~TRINITY_DN88911_c0_g1_i1.p1  ORF type:complete len:113 (-),score=36.28 TRINITY_DN88911_c0_g1_i1:71-409(-)
MAYFILAGTGLSEEKERNILINCGSIYSAAALEPILNINFHDFHEHERHDSEPRKPQHKKGNFRGRDRAHLAEEEDEDSSGPDHANAAGDSSSEAESDEEAHQADDESEVSI